MGLEDVDSRAEPRGQSLEIYPNPATDHVRVKVSPLGVGGSEGWANVRIIDLTGKVLIEMSNDELRLSVQSGTEVGTSNSEVELDIRDIAQGIYSIILLSEDGAVYSEKLEVE